MVFPIGFDVHPREQGAGVSVTRFWKAGSVDYKKVPQLRGVDLDACRSKAREEVRVTESKWGSVPPKHGEPYLTRVSAQVLALLSV